MTKKIILLIGIIIILSISLSYARGGGGACPSLEQKHIQRADYVIYSNQTDTLIFRYPYCSSFYSCYGIIRNYNSTEKFFSRKTIGYVKKLSDDSYITEWEYDYINITSPFINSTNQEEINIIYLNHLQNSCDSYNFGKVTYHEKAIAGTHYY